MLYSLVHTSNELVDELATVASIATLDEADLLLSEATGGGVELEVPEEGVGSLEVGTNGVELVDEVLNADDVLGTKVLSDELVGDADTLTIDLSITTLVDEVGDGLARRSTPGDIRSNTDEHVEGSLVSLHEGSVVDLAETEELKDLTNLGGNTVGTEDTDNEVRLGLSREEVLLGSLGVTLLTDDLLLLGDEGLGVLLSTGSDDLLDLDSLDGSLSLGNLGASATLLDELGLLVKGLGSTIEKRKKRIQ